MLSDSGISPRILIVLSIPVILFILIIAITSNPITPNQMNLEVQTYGGGTLQTTEAYNDKIVIVEFFTTWCAGCKEITNNLKTILSNDTFNKNDFSILSVSLDQHDNDEVFTNFISNYELTAFTTSGQWTFSRDTQEQHVFYNVGSIPHSFLVGKNGTILDQHKGVLDPIYAYSWIELARLG